MKTRAFVLVILTSFFLGLGWGLCIGGAFGSNQAVMIAAVPMWILAVVFSVALTLTGEPR